MRPLVQQPVVSHPTRAGRASCMRQRIQHTVTAPAHTYSTRPAPWNRPPRASPTPPQRGTLLSFRRGISSPPLEGWRALHDGVVREFKNTHFYSPLSSRTKHDGGWGAITTTTTLPACYPRKLQQQKTGQRPAFT